MSSEIVRAVRAEFPKFSKAALSLGRRPDETGVQFVPRAAEIIEAVEGRTKPHKRFSENRRKSISFRCRLSPMAAHEVKLQMFRRGVNQQDLIEALLVEWAEWSKKEPLTAATDSGSKGGNKYENAPASENNKTKEENQE